MGNRKLKGQSTLETAFVFIVLILLFGGIFNLWIWANKQLVQRQRHYNESRVQAGTSRQDYQLEWPLERAEALNESNVLLNPP